MTLARTWGHGVGSSCFDGDAVAYAEKTCRRFHFQLTRSGSDILNRLVPTVKRNFVDEPEAAARQLSTELPSLAKCRDLVTRDAESVRREANVHETPALLLEPRFLR